MVSGNKSASTCINRSVAVPEKRSSNDRGNPDSSTGGISLAFVKRQNAVAGNDSRHHCRHRSTVRRSTPTSDRNLPARRGVSPASIAATSTTSAPRYTRRPKNRNDGGVTRRRQPSRSQQKLNR